MNPNAVTDNSVRLTQLKQTDEACERFEQAWQSGEPPAIEAFLDAADTVVRPALFRELLRLDHVYRCMAGEQLSREKYRERFPEYSELIGLVLQETAMVSVTEDFKPTAHTSHHPKVASFGPGDWIDEFEIKEELGKGAFGTVYRAWQHGVDREVAIKLSTLGSHEPRTMAQLDGHRNIVRIYDQRQIPDRNLHIVYMEFDCGVTLRSVIGQIRDRSIGRDSRTRAAPTDSCAPNARKQAIGMGHGESEASPDRKRAARWSDQVWRWCRRKPKVAGQPCRLGVEPLERRELMAVTGMSLTSSLLDQHMYVDPGNGASPPSEFVVTRTSDSGAGSLRWAIEQANADPLTA
jgi:hypothetical protein